MDLEEVVCPPRDAASSLMWGAAMAGAVMSLAGLLGVGAGLLRNRYRREGQVTQYRSDGLEVGLQMAPARTKGVIGADGRYDFTFTVGGEELEYHCGTAKDDDHTRKGIRQSINNLFLCLSVREGRALSHYELLKFTLAGLDRDGDQIITREEVDRIDRQKVLPQEGWIRELFNDQGPRGYLPGGGGPRPPLGPERRY